MKESVHTPRIARWAAVIIYFLAIGFVSYHSYKKPEYNWDMLPYMGLVLQKDFKNINIIHEQTYEQAQLHIPDPAYKQLTDTSNPYRKKMYQQAEEFYAQLPYYTIKPIYVEVVRFFYLRGMPLPLATVFPSVISYFLMGAILLLWVSSFLRLPYAVMGCLLFMFSPPMFTAAGLSSPDALSSLFLLVAFYFMLQRPRIFPSFLFILLAVWTRLDNIIAAFLLILLWNYGKKPDKSRILASASMLVVLTASYFIINSFSRELGGKVVLYARFYRFPNMVADYDAAFSLKTYVQVLYSRGISGIYNSNIIVCFLFVFLGMIGVSNLKFHEWGTEQLFLLVFLITFAIRYLLYPEISDRFYLAFYIAIYILFLKRYAQYIFHSERS